MKLDSFDCLLKDFENRILGGESISFDECNYGEQEALSVLVGSNKAKFVIKDSGFQAVELYKPNFIIRLLTFGLN